MTVLPWYRQFWPWFVISIPAATVVAGVFTVWLSMQSDDSLAVSSQFGVDVATEHNLAAEKVAVENDITASLNVDSASGAVSVTLAAAVGVRTEKPLQLMFLHPTLARQDSEIELSPAIPSNDGLPVWAGHFVALDAGRRYVVLTQDDAWRISGEWRGEQQITLDAVADGND